jgi:7-carboxy-7-deazaguanine synthase (Cx14CxxC type)
MSYAVKEIFKTLQGEGRHAGRAAVFCRFSGCNLWSGREKTRAKSICTFCDTDFVGTNGSGGGRFASGADLVAAIERCWGDDGFNRFVVLTGGEPLLQVDAALVDSLKDAGFEIGVETNGTIAAPAGLDWICVSPKAGAQLAQRSGNELKLVYPQRDLPPDEFASFNFDEFWLQPMDGPARLANTEAAVAYCLANPRWRLSLQTHKMIGIP